MAPLKPIKFHLNAIITLRILQDPSFFKSECYYNLFVFGYNIHLDMKMNSLVIMVMHIKIGFTQGKREVEKVSSSGGVPIRNLELPLASDPGSICVTSQES